MFRWMTTACLLLLPSFALAQQPVQLSDYQINANDSGVKALIAQDFPSALANFQASLRLGEANITWLNLGRTYQKMGRCMEAKDAYAKAQDAPVISSPSPAEIASILKAYSDELPEVCPSTVTIKCEEGVKNPVLNGAAVTCDTPLDWALGPLEITAENAQELVAADLSEGESRILSLVFLAPETKPSVVIKKQPTPAPSNEMSGLKTTALAIGGLGVVALGTAVVLDATWVKTAVDDANSGKTQPLINEAESRQNMNKILIFSGAALALGGGVLYLLAPDETETALWIAPTLNGAAVGGTF